MVFSHRNLFFIGVSTLVLVMTLNSAFSADSSGQTANGCSYQVINGKYLYNCDRAAKTQKPKSNSTASTASTGTSSGLTAVAPRKNSSDAAALNSSNSYAQPQSTRPVGSYSSVPTVNNTNAPKPSFIPAEMPATNQSQTRVTKRSRHDDDDDDSPIKDSTYLGAVIGSTSISAQQAGSSVGAGLVLGSNIDDNFGLEIGYSYSGQSMNLGLANRANSTIAATGVDDSKLSSNLISITLQYHLTDSYQRLRPYFGLGAGFRHNNLADTAAETLSDTPTNSSLSQNSLGALAAIGAKLRFTDTLQGVFAFNYFIPVMNSDPSLDNPSGNARLTTDDSSITKASLYQVIGGLQYIF